jgi:hypothetical protein
MNVWNLLTCLQATCPNTHFKVSDDEGREAEFSLKGVAGE